MAIQTNGKGILEFIGYDRKLRAEWWKKNSGVSFSLGYSIESEPKDGRIANESYYSWGFETVGEAIWLRGNLTSELGPADKSYGNEPSDIDLMVKFKYHPKVYFVVKVLPDN